MTFKLNISPYEKFKFHAEVFASCIYANILYIVKNDTFFKPCVNGVPVGEVNITELNYHVSIRNINREKNFDSFLPSSNCRDILVIFY